MNRLGLALALTALAACSGPPIEEGPDLGKADGLADAGVEPSVSDLPFEAGDWICGDDSVQVALFAHGFVVDGDVGLGVYPKEDPQNEVRIRVDGKTHVFNRGVIVSTDGGGNYNFQLLYMSHFEDWTFPFHFTTASPMRSSILATGSP
jgi:hypothetical protein